MSGIFSKIFGIIPRRNRKIVPGHRFNAVVEVIEVDNSEYPYRIKLLGETGELTKSAMYISREELLQIETLGNPKVKKKLLEDHIKNLQNELKELR